MTWLTGWRRTATTALAAATLLLAAGCGGDDPKADPTPTTPAPSTSASPTKPAWASKYTDKEYADYQAAVARYADFLAHNDSFYNPPDPVKAKKVVDEYFNQKEGLYQLKVVKWARDHELRSDNNVKPLWTKMTAHGRTMQGNPQVTMRQCVDARHVRAWKDGKRLHDNHKTPVINEITMGQTPPSDGSRWVITTILDTGDTELGVVPCHAG